MATITSLAPIEVPARETAITLCLQIVRECFNLQNNVSFIDPMDPMFNAWFVMRRTVETIRESDSMQLSRKHRAELDEALYVYHVKTCGGAHYDVCKCGAANLIQRLLSTIEGKK